MPRGTNRTPAFMPVGTAATVKAMYPEQVRALGADIVLGNVYHLMLRPGAERVARLGGLHALMRWPHPILTDSGGFQVMSLSALRTLDEAGVTFRSHIDGSVHALTPERSIALQGLLGEVRGRLRVAVRQRGLGVGVAAVGEEVPGGAMDHEHDEGPRREGGPISGRCGSPPPTS